MSSLLTLLFILGTCWKIEVILGVQTPAAPDAVTTVVAHVSYWPGFNIQLFIITGATNVCVGTVN